MLGAGVQVEDVRSRRSSGECQEQEVMRRIFEATGHVRSRRSSGDCQEQEVNWRM